MCIYLELSIGNIIRRVLFIIREESQGGSKKPKEDQKTHTSLSDILGKTKSSQDSQTSSTHIDILNPISNFNLILIYFDYLFILFYFHL